MSFRFHIEPRRCALALTGSAIQAFGLYNIHAFAGVTEGGVLGLTLLLHHWLGLSPAISGFVLNAICYLIGFKVLGVEFILYSAIGGGGFSLFYAICEQFPPVWPDIASHPLIAAVVGAIFVGVGVGAGELKKADTIYLMANEARKAQIVARVVNEPATPAVPASMLMDHANLTFYLDKDAAALL